MISALVFDCFGVLYQGSRQYLFDITPEASHTALQDLNHASDHGFIDYGDYMAQASELTGRPVTELEEIFTREHRRNDELIAYIRTKKTEYKIGLLSNVGPQVMERLFPLEEQAELFDAVVLSCDVTSVKPHPEMYETILERLNVPAGEAVMIDDSRENIVGAEAVGMKGIVFISTDETVRNLETVGI